MRRIPLARTAAGSGNGGIIIAPPPLGDPPADCPTVPALAQWQDITEVFPCTGNSPAEATIAAGLFTATPGADTSTLYTWDIDKTGMVVPYACIIIPTNQAIFEANFRYFSAANAAIQAPITDIVSPYFMLRPDGNTTDQMYGYQPNTSFGDAGNGLTDTVTFRVLCIPIDPA
jgi:hypothetical protein